MKAKATVRQEVLAQRTKLKDARFDDQQADAIIQVCEAVEPDLATKSDLDLLKTELQSKVDLFKLETRVFSSSAGKDSPVAAFPRAKLEVVK